MVYPIPQGGRKNDYTARNSQYVIVRNLSKSTLCSRFLNIQTDGDFSTAFQAPMTLLLKVLPNISKTELFIKPSLHDTTGCHAG